VEAELPIGVKECIVGKLVFGSSDSRLKVGVVSGASSRLWEVVVPHIGKHCWTVGEVGSLSGAQGVETFDYSRYCSGSR
jgi:hypothetical protein